MNLPYFPLYPNAYRLQVFEDVAGVCEVCETPRHYRYTGLFYSQEEVGYICPWCVANGAAAAKFSGRFNDEMGIEGTEFGAENAAGVVNVTWTISDANISLISRHTPAYQSWQQGRWLVCCDQPCAFVDYADSAMLEPIWHEIEADVMNNGIPVDWVKSHLRVNGDFAGYLFLCLDCGKHRLLIDSV